MTERMSQNTVLQFALIFYIEGYLVYVPCKHSITPAIIQNFNLSTYKNS